MSRRAVTYLLFAGDTYYPAGGYRDFRGSFATLEDARDSDLSHYDWAHVVYDNRIVWSR